MAGLRNGHICKNLIQIGEPQKCSWGTQEKKKIPCQLELVLKYQLPVTQSEQFCAVCKAHTYL